MFYLISFNKHDKELFDKFGAIIVSQDKHINELDAANILRSLAHFKDVNYKILETIIKVVIKEAESYNVRTLADIAGSLAALDIKNTTVFEIIKVIVTKSFTIERKEGNSMEEIAAI
jgi:hypothetical protein